MPDYPYMPLWVGDYLRDTRHLSAREHGAYLLLLMEAWRRPSCALPDDDTLLARWAAVSADEWAEIRPVIMAFWRFDGRKKEWVNKKLSRTRLQAQETSKKQAGRATSGWEKRKKTDAAAMPRQSRGNANTQMVNEKEEAKASSKKGGRANACRIPDGWRPSPELGRWAMSEFGWSREQVSRIADGFVDYWRALSGAKARKLDWDATFRNRCRDVAERGSPQTPPKGPNGGKADDRLARKLAFFAGSGSEERPAAGEGLAGDEDRDVPESLLALRVVGGS